MEQLKSIMDVKLQEYINLIYETISTPINGRYCNLTSPELDIDNNLIVYVTPYLGEQSGFTVEAYFNCDGKTFVKTITDKNNIAGIEWFEFRLPPFN